MGNAPGTGVVSTSSSITTASSTSTTTTTSESTCKHKTNIVYSSGYNISFLGLENLHPFDSKKYGRVVQFLIDKKVITLEQLLVPKPVTNDVLIKVHSIIYLKSLLLSSETVARILEVLPLQFLPINVLDAQVLTPMRLATGGTIMAVIAALVDAVPPPALTADAQPSITITTASAAHTIDKIATKTDTKEHKSSEQSQSVKRHGWAINLGGGYHHCSGKQGGGFCVYADISLAIVTVSQQLPHIRKFIIIDLDAHQGNGYANDKLDGVFEKVGADVYILDMFNGSIYPGDIRAKLAINKPIVLKSGTSDVEYLSLLKTALNEAFAEFQPQLIIYNAGTDCLSGDPLGQLNISAKGICERDSLVFQAAFERSIPIAMVLSGGYQKSNALVIANSIENLDRQFSLVSKELNVASPLTTVASTYTSDTPPSPVTPAIASQLRL